MQLLRNGEIRTMQAAMPRAEAAVIQDGRFVYVGTEQGARLWLSGKRYTDIDAAGSTVIPGFNDAHLHLVHTAIRQRRVNLAGAVSVKEIQERLRERLDTMAQGWLIGEGWNQEAFHEKRLVTRADLDAVSTAVPILAARACGHILAANSFALSMAGLESVSDGILREDEQDAVWALVPPLTVEEKIESVMALERDLLSQGITSLQSDDLGNLSGEEASSLLQGIRDAGDSGRFRVRYAAQVLRSSLPEMEDFFERGMHHMRGDRFHVAHMKLLADGSLGARTAWLSSPYADEPGQRGIAIYGDEALAALVNTACAHAMPVAVHAIGDAAMAQVIAVLRQAISPVPLRHAIVHAQITNTEQLWACGELGLGILAQPIFLLEDTPIVQARVGSVLADTSYRWRSMMGAGACVAFSTDCPVEPFHPLPNLYCAITRHAPGRSSVAYLAQEAFSLEEALYAYTSAGAFISGEENTKGKIMPGMLADFLIFDTKLVDHEPEQLLATKVRETYIDGIPVFQA